MSRRQEPLPAALTPTAPHIDDLMSVAAPRAGSAIRTPSDACSQLTQAQSIRDRFVTAYREVHGALNALKDSPEITEARKEISRVLEVTNAWARGDEKRLPVDLKRDLLATERILEARTEVPASEHGRIRERVFQQWRSSALETSYRTIDRHTADLKNHLTSFDSFLTNTPELRIVRGYAALKALAQEALTSLDVRNNLA
ncbi:MAG: hypothetical protein K1X79_12160, partial [Oligoflexia bacterium]|nr:hypothetical protein [Oligoflexia bacterium]